MESLLERNGGVKDVRETVMDKLPLSGFVFRDNFRVARDTLLIEVVIE